MKSTSVLCRVDMPLTRAHWLIAGVGACLLGAFVGAAQIAVWVTEKTYEARLSGCEKSRAFGGGIAVYSEGVVMLRCKAALTKDGVNHVAELVSILPGDFDADSQSKRVLVAVSALDGGTARFAAFPRDWSSFIAKVLLLEFLGAMLILKSRRAD